MLRPVVRAVELLTLGCALVAIGLLAYRPAPHRASTSTSVPAAGSRGIDGASVYADHCTGCHGRNGEGGIGPKLRGGAVVTRYPDPAAEREIIARGQGGMPAWSTTLSPAEIDAVVAYTRS